MASGEALPLRTSSISILSTLAAKRPDLHPADEFTSRLINLPLEAFQHHYCAILTTVFSSMLCTQMGYAEVWVIDPMIIKSIFVLFGFTMGFRNVRANQRYFDAMHQATLFFAGFWGVYAPLPREVQVKVRENLLESMQYAAGYIHRVADSRDNAWHGILGIEPPQHLQAVVDKVGDSPEGFDIQGLDARLRLVQVLILIDSELQKRGDKADQRTYAIHQKQVLDGYDHLLALALPSVTNRFKIFVQICLAFFSVFMPWGIMTKPVEFYVLGYLCHISAGTFLMVNTTSVIWVLFTLNSIINQNEDPVSGDADDVNLVLLTDALVFEVQDYENRMVAKGMP